MTLELPALRDRPEDIPLLVERFLSDINADVSELPPGAMARFMEHNWPGNCRELRNAVERAVVLGETKFLHHQGEPATPDDDTAPARDVLDLERPYKEQKAAIVADFERRYVTALLQAHKGNVSAAARQAGIDRMSLHKILTRYGLDAKTLGRAGADQ